LRALAIIPVRNEADILPWTVQHLVDQGVEVYVIDNWSTDGSWEMLSWLPISGRERFPSSGPEDRYNCLSMLRRIDEVAAASKADWCIFHDADEIRRSPRPGETIVRGLQRVEAEGYNAVNHNLYLFRPIDDDYVGDPERHFSYYTRAHVDCGLNHIKAWKNAGRLTGLGTRAAGGGHAFGFPGMNVHPQKWVLKHYPIRGQRHGTRKMAERLNRWNAEERSWGWHVQYEGLSAKSNFLQDPNTLQCWEDNLPRVTIVTLSRFKDIFLRLHESLNQWAATFCRVMVSDGDWAAPSPWTVVRGKRPFVFAHNWNIAIGATDPDSDVLFTNDDVIFHQPGTIEELRRAAYSKTNIGIVSPQVVGSVANPLQVSGCRLREVTLAQHELAFVCVYIKRAVLSAVGEMDERFTGYGSDDFDFCRRAQQAGFTLAVTPKATVIHGHDNSNGSTSYRRIMSDSDWRESMADMNRVLEQKWA
jgi:Glycosyl transferase family 2